MASDRVLGHLSGFIDSPPIGHNSGKRGNNHLEATRRKWLIDYSVTMFRHKLLLPDATRAKSIPRASLAGDRKLSMLINFATILKTNARIDSHRAPLCNQNPLSFV